MNRNADTGQTRLSVPQENFDLESRHWFERNAKKVIVGCCLLFIIGIVWAFSSASQAAREETVALQVLEAKSAEDYLQVARKYTGTKRAAIAYIQAASLQNASADWNSLRDISREFLQKYPNHRAAYLMSMALGTALEALGQNQEAIAIYQEIAEKHPETFRAPEALFRAAEIMLKSDSSSEAKALFEKIIQLYPASIWAGFARQRLGQTSIDATSTNRTSRTSVSSASAPASSSSTEQPPTSDRESP